MFPSYRITETSYDLQCKSIEWFPYDNKIAPTYV